MEYIFIYAAILLLCRNESALCSYRIDIDTHQLEEMKSANHLHFFAIQHIIYDGIKPVFTDQANRLLAVGFNHVDLLLTVCNLPSCFNQYYIISKVIEQLNTRGFQMIWIEINPDFLTRNTTANREFILNITTTITSSTRGVGFRVGLNGSYEKTFGQWQALSIYPLWYVNYNNEHNFADYITIGGWIKPSLKSYKMIEQKDWSNFAELVCF
jgi:hypothetical protein